MKTSKENKNNMGDFVTQHWQLLLGGGTITSIFGWFFYGRKNNNIEYAIKSMAVFEKLQEELEKDRDYYKQEYITARNEHKGEVLYFRTKIDELQQQFNSMSVSYTKEVEVSQNWEKLYRELTIQNKELEKSNEIIKAENETIIKEQSELKIAHEKLKIDHEKLKKAFNLQQRKISVNPEKESK